MSTSNHVPTMYETVSAVNGLNKVQGFDPLKFLRREVSRETNEEVLKLDLRYKKLWFRLAYPQGRLKLNALRITEQLAIFEAKVFLDRSDSEPVGNYTATCTVENAPNGSYVEAAQEAALDEALTIAGFGLQFADTCAGKKNQFHGNTVLAANIPGASKEKPANGNLNISKESAQEAKGNTGIVSAEVNENSSSVTPTKSSQTNNMADGKGTMNIPLLRPIEKKAETIQTSTASAIPVTVPMGKESGSGSTKNNAMEEMDQLPTDLMDNAHTGSTKPELSTGSIGTVKTAAGISQAQPIQNTLPIQTATGGKTSTPISGTGTPAKITEAPAEATGTPVSNIQELPQSHPAYTADMTVEEIMAKMTLEEAKNVRVDVGTCNGWTIGRVAEERTASLRWYVYGYKDNNNILRAAAKIMLDYLTSQKAG